MFRTLQSDAQHVQNFAEAYVRNRVRVPMRQQYDGALATRRKPARIHQIIFRIRRFHRRREPQELRGRSFHFSFELRIWDFAGGENLHVAFLNPEIGRPGVGIKLIAGGDDAAVEVDEDLRWITRSLSRLPAIPARPVPRKLHAPVERTHHAVVVYRSQTVFPVVHPLCVMRGHG
jgi:hypothetical protein